MQKLVFLLIYLLAMQVLLPSLPKRFHKTAFLSTWELFSHRAPNSFVDISYDNGASYLIRDHMKYLKKSNINTHAFYKLVQSKNITKIQSILSSKTSLKKVDLITLKSNHYDHLVLRKDAVVLHKIGLSIE